MRTASTLLALVIVLGFVSKIVAGGLTVTKSYQIDIRGQVFGFCDSETRSLKNQIVPSWQGTIMFAGPLGQFNVPFTSTQGLVGFYVLVAMLVTLAVVLTFRWKKKRPK
jgi:hypothetical protein